MAQHVDRTDSRAQYFTPKECLEFSVSNARVLMARGSAEDRDHHSGRLLSVQHTKAGVMIVFQLAASPPYLPFSCPQPAARLPLHLPLTVPHLLPHLLLQWPPATLHPTLHCHCYRHLCCRSQQPSPPLHRLPKDVGPHSPMAINS